ncbi:MAG: hypothetical protein IH987_15065 [Planctomycetes bacterium]|nr:hypothetical protein [Planctomycetota bacterium]
MMIWQTVDTFIDSVEWGDNRAVLVHHRQHGGRKHVRFRTWNRHKDKGVWYPTKRGFIVPVGNAEPLATALRAGADGVEGSKPDWFLAWEREESERTKSAISAA